MNFEKVVCLICGQEPDNPELLYVCEDCIEKHADFDFLHRASRRCKNFSEHKLDILFGWFFEKDEDIEEALVYFIKEKFSEEEIKKRCIEFASEDDGWIYFRILEKKEGIL